MPEPIPYIFFGSAIASVHLLNELAKLGSKPTFIVTTPDKPADRLALTPTPVKVWGNEHGIPVTTPDKLDENFIKELRTYDCPVYIVAAYGKIIPQAVIDIPKRGALNIHPSALPLYRGATPLQSSMLDDAKETAVSIILIDSLMDHGPIVAQEPVTIKEWPIYEEFEKMMFERGAKLLVSILPDWVSGKTHGYEQDHTRATFTKKITKEDGLVDYADITSDSPKVQYDIYRKIQAFHLWPTVYFFIPASNSNTKKIRVKITNAFWHNKTLIIDKVIPEGRKEMDYEIFLRNI